MRVNADWIANYRAEAEEKLIELQQVQDIRERVDILYRLAELYNDLKEYEEAEKYGDILYQLCCDHNLPKRYAKVLYLIGYNNFSMDRYAVALEYYYEALPLYKLYFSNEQIAVILNEIGRNYNRVKDYKKALSFYQEAINYYDNNAIYYSNLASMYLELGELENARLNFDKVKILAAETGDVVAQALTYANQGQYHYARKEYSETMEYFRKSQQQFKEIDWLNYMVQIQIEIGVLQDEMGDSETALKTLEECVILAKKVNRDLLVSKCYKHISAIYEKRGDANTALKYIHLYSELKEQYYSEKLHHKIGELNSRYESSKRETRAKQMLDKASHLASIGVMTAGITHEINQPLNAIKICADSILFSEEINPGTIPATYLEDIEQIAQGTRRIEEIINHLRSYWEMTDAESDDNETVGINEGVNSVLNLMGRQLISHGIILKTRLIEEDSYVSSSKIKLEQIVINLLNNSLQSLDSIHQRGKKISVITSKPTSDMISLKVCDNGPGIKAEVKEHIFDPFFTTKQPGKGMGLGLAITKEIIDNVNGTIEVSDNPEGGVCFEVRLPIRS